MERNELLTLVAVTGTQRDGNGFVTGEQTAQKEVFCAVKSVGRKEHYEALRSGIKASIIFVVDKDDFDAAAGTSPEGKKVRPSRAVDIDGNSYRIVRTYGDGGDLELTCEEVE